MFIRTKWVFNYSIVRYLPFLFEEKKNKNHLPIGRYMKKERSKINYYEYL